MALPHYYLTFFKNGKRSYEFLKELKLLKISSPIDRNENRERLELAERIKNKREHQLQGDEYSVTPAFRKGVDFIQFFENCLTRYTKKDNRIMRACYGKFRAFLREEGFKTLSTKQMNKTLVVLFKEYLEQNLNGETPGNYFKKFKKVLQYGVRENVFSKNPLDELSREEVQIKRSNSIKKEILSFDEIKKLAGTQITNNEVKRAFLFSCLTGLRFCDVNNLKWKNIQRGVLNITQQKTGIAVRTNLNQSANNILGKAGRGEDSIFTLPSHTACNKNLKHWCGRMERWLASSFTFALHLKIKIEQK